MTREEEINEAVNTYMNGLFEDGVEIPIEDFENIEEGFIAGAQWADNHLINVWHDVTEEPMDRRRTIVLYGTNPVGVTSCNYEDILLTFRETWSTYVFLSKFSLWAYLDELLPKGVMQ